jgi:thioredoxin reductase
LSFDVVIVGGGPAGLAAALLLGRARKRVLLCDAGPRRNAAATHVHGFVTRDGTPPEEFRRAARQQLEPYPSVTVQDAPVDAIAPRAGGGFDVTIAGNPLVARRVVLATGMIDDVPAMPDFRELWGRAIVQCPYCHGWEVRDRRFGYLAPRAESVEWALLLRGWTDDVVVFTDDRFAVPADARARLESAGIGLEERPLLGLEPTSLDGPAPVTLAYVVLVDGTRIARDVLFAHPPQRQTPLVAQLGLALDDHGYVRIDEHTATSMPGVHAAGDLTTGYQSATLAAAAGFRAAAAVNHALTIEDAVSSRVA